MSHNLADLVVIEEVCVTRSQVLIAQMLWAFQSTERDRLAMGEPPIAEASIHDIIKWAMA